MITTDLSNSFCPVPKQKNVQKKDKSGQKSKKYKQTKATEIPRKVKEIVWKRDKQRCIFCYKLVPIECACCHYIPRSLGGMGIPENLYTGCSDCHREQDNGMNTKVYDDRVESYLRSIYGTSWSKEKLIYSKWR